MITRKNIFKLMLLILLIAFSLCSCDMIANVLGNANQNPQEHKHNYSVTTTQPTCTEPGFNTYTCECGDQYVADIINTVAHTEVVTSGKAPTCTSDGTTDGSHCSVCNEILTAQTVIKATGHTLVTDNAIAPTCTKTGLTEGKHCSVCNTVTVEQKTVKANGHTYTNGICSVCGDNDTAYIPPIEGEFDYAKVPEWSGSNYVVVNGNTPYFTNDEITNVSFESYSPLDSLGRAQVAFASIGKDIMPTGTRPSISYKPTGWVQATYPPTIVPQGQIYNRSHLIAWSLAGEGNNELNLITATPYFNQIGMQIFESQILDYIRETENHVMLRVTPVYVGNELVARGVLMEGWSVEDNGDGICFNVFMYNIQPGITINYATGESYVTPVDDPSGDDNNGNDTIATLVTDVSQIKVGDKIVIVSKDQNYAMGALSGSGNNRSAVEVTKNGDTIIVNSDVSIITVGQGNSAGTYSFKVGDKYIYAASSASNHLKEQTSLNDNGSWRITISSNGSATIKSTGTYTRNWLRFNKSNLLFSAYASGQNDVCIYIISE